MKPGRQNQELKRKQNLNHIGIEWNESHIDPVLA